MKNKLLVGIIGIVCFIPVGYLGYRFVTDDWTPAITNTAFTINIDDDYDVIQTSATTCNFVKDEKIHQMKIIVERVDKLNFNHDYVVMETYDNDFYIYDKKAEQFKKSDNEKDFIKLQQKLSIDLPLKEKSDFEWSE